MNNKIGSNSVNIKAGRISKEGWASTQARQRHRKVEKWWVEKTERKILGPLKIKLRNLDRSSYLAQPGWTVNVLPEPFDQTLSLNWGVPITIKIFLFQLLAGLAIPWMCLTCKTYLPLCNPGCGTCGETLQRMLGEDISQCGVWRCCNNMCGTLNDSSEQACVNPGCVGMKEETLYFQLQCLAYQAHQKVWKMRGVEVSDTVSALYKVTGTNYGRGIVESRMPRELQCTLAEIIGKVTEFVLERNYQITVLPIMVSYWYRCTHVTTALQVREKAG